MRVDTNPEVVFNEVKANIAYLTEIDYGLWIYMTEKRYAAERK